MPSEANFTIVDNKTVAVSIGSDHNRPAIANKKSNNDTTCGRLPGSSWFSILYRSIVCMSKSGSGVVFLPPWRGAHSRTKQYTGEQATASGAVDEKNAERIAELRVSNIALMSLSVSCVQFSFQQSKFARKTPLLSTIDSINNERVAGSVTVARKSVKVINCKYAGDCINGATSARGWQI